tara:strand:- start:213 stop:386 length:174 start_codon:yes stop_codon:yes gene_type:complete
LISTIKSTQEFKYYSNSVSETVTKKYYRLPLGSKQKFEENLYLIKDIEDNDDHILAA